MQEIQYGDGRRIAEVFHGANQQEIFDRMRARSAELEKDGDIVKLTRREIGRNSKCWCGSGRKVKRCCGKVGT